MRIEMDTFHPANSKVYLSHSEVVILATALKAKDDEVVLSCDSMNYERPKVTYLPEGMEAALWTKT